MQKELIQQILTLVEDFDVALDAYEKESSDQNRETFAQKHAAADEVIKNAPIEVRGEISEPWGTIAVHMNGLKTDSNKFMKFASFGMSAGTAGASLGAIRGENGKIIKILRNLYDGKPAVTAAGTVVKLSDEHKEIATKIKEGLVELDTVLQKYEDESNDENREEFARVHGVVGELIKNAPIEVRGEISDSWGKVDLQMNGLKTSSNKFMKVASFGMSAGAAGASLGAIRGEIGKMLKILDNLISGKAVGGAVGVAVELSEEHKEIATKIKEGLVEFDTVLQKYEDDSSDENREEFARVHGVVGELIKNAPIEVRGEISDSWGKVDVHMNGLKTGSNKFMKFASFGMSAGTAGASLGAIRGEVGKMMKILDNLISGKVTAVAGGTVIELSEENRELATKIKDGLGEFDAVLQKYEDDSSDENREEFARVHGVVGELIKNAPIEVRGEISDSWGKVDLQMNGLKTSSNKFMKVASFGMSAGAAGASLGAIRGEVGKIIKILTNILDGKPVGGAGAAVAVVLTTEHATIANNLYHKLVDFDAALQKYEDDSSDANREEFARVHGVVGEIVKTAPTEVRGEISDSWGQIDVHMNGLKTGSNKFMKFASFGMSAGTAGASLGAIRGEVGKIMKILKAMKTEDGASVVLEAPTVEKVAPVEAPVEEVAAAEASAEASAETPAETTVVEETPAPTPVEEAQPVAKETVSEPAKKFGAGDIFAIISLSLFLITTIFFWAGFYYENPIISMEDLFTYEAIVEGGGVINFFVYVVGLVFGAIGIKKAGKLKGLAIPGLILNILSLVFCFISFLTTLMMITLF